MSDEEVVTKVLEGAIALYEVLVGRYNQRLFRICRAILGNNTEARDVVQQTYAQAYEHLRQFEGRGKFSNWLTTIAVHEASLRRRSNRVRSLGELQASEPPRQTRYCLPRSISRIQKRGKSWSQ
ncbi:MAG: hypothetical protein DMG69_25725 [Acidobacteria bacterium]|nr:MAG: hypothetical protein DMG69_25725 [Acidobacteriota bacterium]